MRIFMSLAVLALAGCGGGGGAYLDTDVAEVSGFDRSSAKDVQMSGGLMQTGTLEYAGYGDVVEPFNEYMSAMKGRGWKIAAVDVQGDRATGTLRKDNRTCTVEFSKASGKTKALIRVGTTK
jgi:hypothetical protein